MIPGEYNEIETKVGIQAYVSPKTKGFAAVIKARYTDFLVHEVGTDGEIARLESLKDNLEAEELKRTKQDTPVTGEKRGRTNTDNAAENTNQNEPVAKKNKTEGTDNGVAKDAKNEESKYEYSDDDNDKAAKEEPLSSSFDGEAVRKELIPHIGEEDAQGVIQILQKWEDYKNDPRPVARRSKPPSTHDSTTTTTTNPKTDSEQTDTKPPLPGKHKSTDTHYKLPPITSKDNRKAIHLLVKSLLLSPYAIADTDDDKRIRIWHRLFERHSDTYKKFDGGGTRGGGGGRRGGGEPNRREGGGKGGSNNRWPTDRPPYLRFVLYKENLDTTTAAKEVARFARLPPKGRREGNWKHGKGGGGGGGMGYAGMKDKRGVTAQFCTVFHRTPKDLLGMNWKCDWGGGGGAKKKGYGLMRVGEFRYVDKYIGLGNLRGNRFDVVLRNVCLDEDDGGVGGENLEEKDREERRITRTQERLTAAADNLRQFGFINYFGLQRFGKALDTHIVGIAVLKNDFEKACDLIMSVKPGEDWKLRETRKKWAARFEGIASADKDWMKDEAVTDKDGKKAEAVADEDGKKDNAAADKGGKKDNTAADEDAKKDKAEADCAREVSRRLGRFMNCEVSIVNILQRRPRDYKRAFCSIAKNMRSMFLHGYQSYLWNRAATHRIKVGGKTDVMVGDLVLARQSGTEQESSGLKEKEVTVVTQIDIDHKKWDITDVVLPLVGSKVKYPTNCTGALFDTMLAEDGLTKENFKGIADRELDLKGDYRRIICKPHDVSFEIKRYKDPDEPLVQTDLMKLKTRNDAINGGKENDDDKGDTTKNDTNDKDGKKKPDTEGQNVGGKNDTDEKGNGKEVETNDKDSGKENDTIDEDGGEEDDRKEQPAKKDLLGMVIGFTLPPSAYATIALRELMKRPTDSKYQSGLRLEGDCEANFKKRKAEEILNANNNKKPDLADA